MKKINNFRIIESPEISLFAKFEKLELSPVSSEIGRGITGEIGAKFLPSVFIGDPVEVYIEEPKIPDFGKTTDISELSEVTLPIFVTFLELEKNIRARVVGESFSSGNNKATIEDIKFFKKYQSIIIDADLSGSFEGRFILSVDPLFDSSKGHIVLKNLSFDLKTDNFLMKSVGWIFKKVLKKKIRENVEEYLKRLDEELLQMAKKSIEKMPKRKGIDLKIDLKKLEIKDLEITDDGINILSKAIGNLSLNLKPDQI